MERIRLIRRMAVPVVLAGALALQGCAEGAETPPETDIPRGVEDVDTPDIPDKRIVGQRKEQACIYLHPVVVSSNDRKVNDGKPVCIVVFGEEPED